VGLEASKQLEKILQQNLLEKTDLTTENNVDKSSFSNMLTDMLSDVNQAQKVADQSIEQLISGDQSTSLQDVVMKMEEADLTFSLMKEIRDKLINAYKETISMQA